jgi:hypothetical protein
MKAILLVFVFLAAINMAALSQIKNLVATSDSSIVVNNVYVGLLNSSVFDSDLNVEHGYNLRIGGNLTWQLSPWIKAKALIVYGRAGGEDLNINFFCLKLHSKNENLGLEFGRMPTLSTEMMPIPLSPGGQFSTWTESQIIGPAVGAKATFRIKESLLGAGISLRDKKLEYHFKLESGVTAAAACYRPDNKMFQSSFSFKPEYLYTISVLKNVGASNLLANYTSVPIGHQLEVCLDAGYCFEEKKFQKLEFGVIKNFKAAWLKGLLYLCYTHEDKKLNAFLLFNI